jgi:hypothetical protein
VDGRRIDRIAIALSQARSRRSLAGVLGVLGLLTAEVAARKTNKKCSRAKTCAGRCGKVKNRCNQRINCGPCPACQRCNRKTKTCVAAPDREGVRCKRCRVCNDNGQCVPCANCCDTEGACRPGTTSAACGKNGDPCDVCTGQEQCQNRSCVCVGDCTGKQCQDNGCGGFCENCPSGHSCRNGACALECEIDNDCPELTESCQSGHCLPVCTAASCPGTNCHCAVEHQDEGNGARQPICYTRLLTESLPCGSCGNEAPTCVIRAEDTNCPTCRTCAFIEPCSCEGHSDCGATTSCQNGTCQPVCTAQSCPGDTCHCAIHYESDGDRTAVCYSTITPSETPCSRQAHCNTGQMCVVTEDRTDCANVSFCSDCSVLTPCA